MSKRTPTTRQSKHRRIVETLATALLVGATGFAIVASGVPGDATANGNSLPDDVEAMKEAFEDYIKSLEALHDSFVASETFTLDEAHSVGAYDLITAFMHSANRQNQSSSGAGRGYPRFSGFDDPDTRIGVDNPDTQYMGAIVNNSDCTQAWRVWGNRGNSVDFILTTFDTSEGTGGGPTLEDEDMVNENNQPLQLNEDYVVYAACQEIIDQHPEWLNTLSLPQSERMQIARRHSHCDWSVERPQEVHIERLGTEGVPSNPLSAQVMTNQIRGAIALNETQAPFWPAFVDTIKQLPVNTASPWLPTGGLGITTQLNMLMWFELEDHESLIVRLPDSLPGVTEDIAQYYGLQLNNFWASSADWANRHVSMNWGRNDGCQAELSQPTFHPAQQQILQAGGEFCGQQDAYFIVLSKNDPGVRNWIETAELSQGMLSGRLQSITASPDDELFEAIQGVSCMLPVAIKVPTAAVQGVLQQLGASFTTADATDRSDTLKMRQNFVRQKYIFW
jgi:hypothetical protein